MPDLSDVKTPPYVARIRLQYLGIWYRVTERTQTIRSAREDGDEHFDPFDMPEEWHDLVKRSLKARKAEIAAMPEAERDAARAEWATPRSWQREKPTHNPNDLNLLMTWALGNGIKARIYKGGWIYFGDSGRGARLEHVLAMVDAYREMHDKPAEAAGYWCPDCDHAVREHHAVTMDGNRAGECTQCSCGYGANRNAMQREIERRVNENVQAAGAPFAVPGDVHAEDLGTHWRIGGYQWRKDLPPILRLLRAGLGDVPEPEPCEPKPFAVGDVVRVKGQSEPMTVLQSGNDEQDVALWSPQHGRVRLPAEVLEPWNPEVCTVGDCPQAYPGKPQLWCMNCRAANVY